MIWSFIDAWRYGLIFSNVISWAWFSFSRKYILPDFLMIYKMTSFKVKVRNSQKTRKRENAMRWAIPLLRVREALPQNRTLSVFLVPERTKFECSVYKLLQTWITAVACNQYAWNLYWNEDEEIEWILIGDKSNVDLAFAPFLLQSFLIVVPPFLNENIFV
jgi:hypothetical protein